VNFRVWVVLAILSTGFVAVAQEAATDISPVRHPGTITGSGTKGHIPRFTGMTTIGNSRIFQSTSGTVGIGTTTPGATLDVNGTINVKTAFSLGGTPFAFGSVSSENVFVGFAGNATMTGCCNTASGKDAFISNTTGEVNTANGESALYSNTTGSYNTANGWGTLGLNTAGNYNTASGADTHTLL